MYRHSNDRVAESSLGIGEEESPHSPPVMFQPGICFLQASQAEDGGFKPLHSSIEAYKSIVTLCNRALTLQRDMSFDKPHGEWVWGFSSPPPHKVCKRSNPFAMGWWRCRHTHCWGIRAVVGFIYYFKLYPAHPHYVGLRAANITLKHNRASTIKPYKTKP